MLDLLYEYKQTLRMTKQQRNRLKEKKNLTTQEKEDIKQYSNIISSLEYVIRWLETGREPGAKRGYDRREVYKRMVLTDPQFIDYINYSNTGKSTDDSLVKLSDLDKRRLDNMLSVLSEREKDIYLLHVAQLFSYNEISNLLGIKKSTVQTYIKRAKNKIQKYVNENC